MKILVPDPRHDPELGDELRSDDGSTPSLIIVTGTAFQPLQNRRAVAFDAKPPIFMGYRPVGRAIVSIEEWREIAAKWTVVATGARRLMPRPDVVFPDRE